MSLKQKTIKGVIWSSIDSLAVQGISFIVGIILARILSPREFGLIGMITVFIAVSDSFVNSGFSNALIRKKDCTQADYSTVFFFNLFAGILFFLLLFLTAPFISQFFNEPELKNILRVLALVIVISALTQIQRTILTKRIDFKLQTRISIIASIGSGLVAVFMAYNGFGVWSLVALQLGKQGLNSLFLWIWNNWYPIFIFSKNSFKELFGFGSKLLISGLIDTIYRNIYYFIIGKFFSAQELGYYTRANQFKDFPSMNVSSIMTRVTFPVLAQIQDDPARLKEGYQRMIKTIMLITFVLMLGMVAVAEPMTIVLIGEKWRASIIYLQMLCFVGMFYPLHVLNLNMLQVKGRSDLFLKLEVIKKIIAIPTIVVGIFFGIKIMIIGMMVNTLIAYYLNSYWSGKLINYSMQEQIMDILPSLLLAFTMALIVYFVGYLVTFSYLIKLIIQLIIGMIITLFFCEISKLDPYIYLKELLIKQLSSIRDGNK